MNYKYKVYKEYTVDQIIPIIQESIPIKKDKIKSKFVTDEGEFNVKINSLRLKCFANNLSCVKCGVTGNVFRLETPLKNPSNPHLNLYHCQSDNLVLMTKDHIKPVSKGGKDHLSNLQTMCNICNEAKANQE